jgi:threonyl-tRNA synthetase
VSNADDYAQDVAARLRSAGLRVDVDDRNEKINYKVREHSLAKVPVILVVGKREMEEHSVNVRRFGSNQQQSVSLADAVTDLKLESVPPDLR